MINEHLVALSAVIGCGLLLMVLLVLLRVVYRLTRIEQALREGAGVAPEAVSLPRGDPTDGSEAQRREFEEFLAEDDSRRGLPKKVQFAAYRSWRKERGLTWGAEKSPGKQ